MKVDGVAHGVDVPILGKIDVGDLAERVHAGIGAAGALQRDALAGKRCDRFGDHALHRDAVVLHLPADERRAVIFDGELVARHGRVTSAEKRGASNQHAFAPDRRPAQKIRGRHRLPAGALQFDQPHRAFAAGNGQTFVEHMPRLAVAVALGRAQHLDAARAAVA